MNTITDCPNCGASDSMTKQSGLTVESLLLGEIQLSAVEPLRCSKCDELLLDVVAWELADELQSNYEAEAIARLPIADFITPKDAYVFLDVSRQAFHQSNRIKNGCIIFTTIGDTKLYYRPSVEEYARSGDGRIRIDNTIPSEKPKWITTYDVNWPVRMHNAGVIVVGAAASSPFISTEDFLHTEGLFWSRDETDQDDDEQPKAPLDLIVARQQ